MVLARPIPLPHDPYRYLLQRDREIPQSMVPRLQQLGILDVWVRHRNLEFLENRIDEELSDRQRDVYFHVRRNFEAVMDGTAAELDVSHFESSVGELFDFLRQSSSGVLLLHKLDAFDNFLLSHSTNVCYLSLLLGMKLEQYLIDERTHKPAREAKDLKELGLGCLLHDVGKMCIPPEILNKPGKLTAEEMELIKMHPVYGYEMVKGRVSTAVSQIVMHHHQRWGGGGYPDRVDSRTGEKLPTMSGKQIPVMSRIATACDVYDAATTHRVYSAAKPPVKVLWEMQTFCKHFFDPVILQAFLEVIPPFPLGQIVMLSDGTEAVVVDFNPRHAYRPKVQALRTSDGLDVKNPALEEIDLAIYREIEIVSVDGHDVTEFVPAEARAFEAAAALV